MLVVPSLAYHRAKHTPPPNQPHTKYVCPAVIAAGVIDSRVVPPEFTNPNFNFPSVPIDSHQSDADPSDLAMIGRSVAKSDGRTHAPTKNAAPPSSWAASGIDTYCDDAAAKFTDRSGTPGSGVPNSPGWFSDGLPW